MRLRNSVTAQVLLEHGGKKFPQLEMKWSSVKKRL